MHYLDINVTDLRQGNFVVLGCFSNSINSQFSSPAPSCPHSRAGKAKHPQGGMAAQNKPTPTSPPQPRARAALGQISRWTVCVGCMGGKCRCIPAPAPRPRRTRPNQPVDCLRRVHGEQMPLYSRPSPHARSAPGQTSMGTVCVGCMGSKCRCIPALAPRRPGPTSRGLFA